MLQSRFLLGFSISGFPVDVGAVRSRRRRGAMSEPSPTQAVNDRAMARAQEEVTRRTALGEFGQPPNLDLRDRAWMEIFEQELSRLSHVIRYGNWVFSGSSAPALHQHPRNKDLIAHFKSKGDSVSWGIAESIEKYEEDTKKKVSRGTNISALYDQETEHELAKEVENRIEEALSAIDPGRVVSAIDPGRVVTAAARGADENKFKTPIQRLAQMFRRNA